MSFAAIMFVALGIDAVLGWPDRLYRVIGHPVTWIGRAISYGEGRLNANRFGSGARMVLGALFSMGLLAVWVGGAWGVCALLPDGWIGWTIMAVLAWPLIAARSMYCHVADVARPLCAGDLGQAREAVAMIVGRDPAALDTTGVARAALESLAENTSDGIVAPVFWGVLLGVPGIVGYKVINTLDSMIGHRTARYEHFGKFAARLDDVVNLVPARLTGILFAICSHRVYPALRGMWRDGGHHRSPNAGWPEAALAYGLSVRLSGPRVYHGQMAAEPYVNESAVDPQADDLARGLRLYMRVMVALAGALGLCAIVLGL
ncbi:cobalamin biosynthesis protein CobD [Rhodobacteraceae bacterium]|nr:cobalamin biosynthesis protein CobD [Paracoccaceae bacterium]